jgi:4a-hydroxytetrahydrobiopterin dehydratase
MNLLNQKCVPCEGGVDPMTRQDAEAMLGFHIPDWKIDAEGKHITKTFDFANFKEALEFVNKTGEIAESEGHHPDIHMVNYKHVTIDLSTHAIGGLSQNDFIVAAKINVIK